MNKMYVMNYILIRIDFVVSVDIFDKKIIGNDDSAFIWRLTGQILKVSLFIYDLFVFHYL